MHEHVTRRTLLKGLAAAGAAAFLPDALIAQARRRGRIDVHHHFVPAFQPNANVGRGWTPQASLDVMGKYGTESAILSLTVAADYLYDGTEKGRAFARRANEYAAMLARDRPGQFGFFAALPLMEPDASLKEIEYAFETLKCEGVSIFSNTGAKWPGDPPGRSPGPHLARPRRRPPLAARQRRRKAHPRGPSPRPPRSRIRATGDRVGKPASR